MSGNQGSEKEDRGLLGNTKKGLNKQRSWLEQEELKSLKHHDEVSRERENRAVKFILNGGIRPPHVSVEKQIMLKALAPWVVIGVVVLAFACFATGTAGWLWNEVKPEPTPMSVLILDPETGVVTQATYMPPTESPAPTQATETLPPSPVIDAPTAVPATNSETHYATWVTYADAPQSPVWNFVQTESLGYYVYVLSAQTCQTPVPLPAGYPSLQALVKVNSSTYYADVVVTNNTVTVMCTGTFDLVALP